MSLGDDIQTVAKAIPADDDDANEALLNVAVIATEHERLVETMQTMPSALRVVSAANWLVQSKGHRGEEQAWRLLEEALSDYNRAV
jgi:hypothetical protein